MKHGGVKAKCFRIDNFVKTKAGAKSFVWNFFVNLVNKADGTLHSRRRMAMSKHSEPVDVVSEEEIVGARWMSVGAEVSQQVVELSVDVAADGDWTAEFEQHRLVEEQRARLHAQVPDRRFRQLDLRERNTPVSTSTPPAPPCIETIGQGRRGP